MFWSDAPPGPGDFRLPGGTAAEGTAPIPGHPGAGGVTADLLEGPSPEAQLDHVAADEEFLAAMAAEFDAIEASLVRLDDGSFDSCLLCGARIGQERLIADPLTTRCPAHS